MLREFKDVKWTKGEDFMDGTPRYTFEGREIQNSSEDLKVVIYSQKERKYSHLSDKKLYYYGVVRYEPTESQDEIGRFNTLKEAKAETIKLFNEYLIEYNM